MPPPIKYTKSVLSTQFQGLKKQVSATVVTEAVATLEKTNMTGGSGPSQLILPPGWGDGTCPAHHQRGHLIGNKLGGPGDEADNLVTLTAGTNHPFMYEYEDAVYRYVSAKQPGQKCTYTVECLYSDYVKHASFPIPGASGNPFCLFPAPSALKLSLIDSGSFVTLGTLAALFPKPPQDLGPAANYTHLLVFNGGYKLYSGASHTVNNCWSVVQDPNSQQIQTAATNYAKKVGYDW